LPRRARHEVIAADHLGNAHRRVVVHHRELIRRSQGVARDDEVAPAPRRVDLDMAQHQVAPCDHSARHAEPPGERTAHARQLFGIRGGPPGAGAAVSRSLVLGMGSRGRARDVAAGAGAGVNRAQVFQSLERGGVGLPVFGLDERAFVPVEPEPAQVVESTGRCLGPDAAGIEVLDPQDHAAPGAAGRQPGDEERAGVAQMQAPGGGRGEAAGGWLETPLSKDLRHRPYLLRLQSVSASVRLQRQFHRGQRRWKPYLFVSA
jgi:hypothetical protein